MATDSPNETKDKSSTGLEKFFDIAIKTISSVGLHGYIIIFATYFLANYSTADQKKEFIDRIFLLKFPDKQSEFVYVYLGLLTIFFLIAIYFYHKRYKLLQEKNNFLTTLNEKLDKKSDTLVLEIKKLEKKLKNKA